MNSKMQHPFRLFLQLSAKCDFWLSRYRKVQIRRLSVIKSLARKFCFADPSATGQNSEARLLKREFTCLSQFSQLNFSPKEPHISPPNGAQRNLQFVNVRFGRKLYHIITPVVNGSITRTSGYRNVPPSISHMLAGASSGNGRTQCSLYAPRSSHRRPFMPNTICVEPPV